jgi:hypothetical protein
VVEERVSGNLARAAGPLAVALVFLWALVRSWGMWPDVQVDFGRELYVPWRIVSGDRLYADLAYFNGPLSAHWNALWFRVFGVGLSTLVWVNILISAAIVVLLFRMLERVSDRFSASVAAMFFAAVFAFGQLTPAGNYNYATPYSHELTHGLALSLLAIAALWGRMRELSAIVTRDLFVAGGIAGLVFLTKPEVFVALALSLGAGLGLEAWGCGRTLGETLRRLGFLALGMLIPTMLAFAWLGFGAGPSFAWAGIAGPWLSIFEPRLSSLAYYRWVMGTLNLSLSVERIALWTGLYLAVLAPLLIVALAARGRWAGEGAATTRMRRLWPALGLLAFVGLLSVRMSPDQASHALRPLSLVTPLLVLASLIAFARAHRGGMEVSIPLLRVVLCVFALGMQAKMFLNTQPNHYGFALVMPATLLFIVALVGWIPEWIRSRSGSGLLFRVGACVAISIVALAAIEKSQRFFEARTTPVAGGRDAFVAGDRAPAMNAAMRYLSKHMGPDETLIVLPEGVMINYLIRRPNPTPYFNVMPPEIILFGERTMLEAYRESPPDYVALVHKKTALYGYPYFGRHYGQAIQRWLDDDYVLVEAMGRPPFRDDTGFGIAILQRRSGRTAHDLREN